jgi:hypothetical protein
MEKERYTFRLSPETIQQLDELIEKGAIQNRTDGVIKGITMLHAAELYKGPVHDFIFKETRSPELIHDWEKFPVGAEIPFYGIPGVKITITKIGPEHIQLVKEWGGRVVRNEVEVKEGTVVKRTSI